MRRLPALPAWAEELPLSKTSKRILARVLNDQSRDTEEQIAGLLSLGGQLEEFLEEVRVIVEEGEQFLEQGTELARQYGASEEDLSLALGAIRRHESSQLRDIVSRVERLKRIAENLQSRRDAGVAWGQAVRIRKGMDETADALKERSCEDRGAAVYAIVDKIYHRMREGGAALTQENFERFLRDFSRRAFAAVRAKRTYGVRVRRSIRDPRERPEIKAEVSRMCSLIVLRDFALRKVVRISPSMLASLLRHVPSEEHMEEIYRDYRALRCLPQNSRALVMAGPLRRSFYLSGEAEEDREAEIEPEIVAACTKQAPRQIVRVEYIGDADMFVLRDALDPADTIEGKIAAPHSLQGRMVKFRSTLGGQFEVLEVSGCEDEGEKLALQQELNLRPMSVLECEIKVVWANESERGRG